MYTKKIKPNYDLEIADKYILGLSLNSLTKIFKMGAPKIKIAIKNCNVSLRSKYPNLTNKVFGRLRVINKSTKKLANPSIISGVCSSPVFWSCLCSCGKTAITTTYALTSGKTKSCGCYMLERVKEANTTHGQSKKGHLTLEFKMFNAARARARKEGIPCNLEVTDIVIPEFCPVLGIKLKSNIGHMMYDSPTLDKIIPSKGYVKGNICVISQKANRIKSDASFEEIQKVADWVRNWVTNNANS